MILKTTLATLITASLAGGVVYYGTQTDTTRSAEVSLEVHPSQSVQVEDDTPEPDTVADDATNAAIDKLLNRDDDDVDIDIEAGPELAEEPELPIAEQAIDEEMEDVGTDENGIDASFEMDVTMPIQSIDSDYEAMAMAAIEKTDLINTAFDQAEFISSTELKDQAYLDVVTYAVKHDLYGPADKALAMIDQAEMRDTARSKIAISLAMGGDTKAAFEMIDQVETENLRDITRLQVIEAMIVPERLPAGLTQR